MELAAVSNIGESGFGVKVGATLGQGVSVLIHKNKFVDRLHIILDNLIRVMYEGMRALHFIQSIRGS